MHEVGRRWVSQGHEVVLHSSHLNEGAKVDSAAGVRIDRVGRLSNGSHHWLAPRAAKRGRADVVLESINTIPYFLPLRRKYPPSVSLVHQMALDVWAEHLPSLLATGAARIEPTFYRPYRTSNLLAVSPSTLNDLEKAGARNVLVVPQGGLGPQPLVKKEEVPTLIFVGRLVQNKRPDHALRAFMAIKRELPSARFWVVGKGPLLDSMKAQSSADVEFLGKLPRDELLDRMGRAHLLVVTSVREGWGLVITEANALGTPAIGYDVPGVRDAIKDQSTGLTTRADPSELAGAAIGALSQADLYRDMREKAIRWGSSFSWDKTAEVVMEHLKIAAGGSS